MKKKKRSKKIKEAIRLAWSSLDSHLKWTHKRISRKEMRISGNNKFHRECVKEYARTIKILSELY